ncbi:MAG: SpoIIE family protein phosphatase [Pseudomonadota bacterium]
MIPHLACPVHEPSQVGDARRQAARMATGLGFDDLALGRLALVVTELATNLVRHAKEGLLLIGVYSQAEVPTIEVICVDRGPGIRDISDSVTDGVSTAGTSGTGLGAVKRLSSQFLIFSKADCATVVVARMTADNSSLNSVQHQDLALTYAGICVSAPGETVSGDSWACRRTGANASLVIADGLGHGPEAAEAADAAVSVFMRKSGPGAADVIESCHAALRATRGAAIAAIDIDVEARSVSYCGAGNISARIINGAEDRTLMSQHGTVGLQIRKVQTIQYELPPHALFVAHSDGIVTRWVLKDVPELLACDPIILAAYLIRNNLRGRDDAAVVVVQCN